MIDTYNGAAVAVLLTPDSVVHDPSGMGKTRMLLLALLEVRSRILWKLAQVSVWDCELGREFGHCCAGAAWNRQNEDAAGAIGGAIQNIWEARAGKCHGAHPGVRRHECRHRQPRGGPCGARDQCHAPGPACKGAFLSKVLKDPQDCLACKGVQSAMPWTLSLHGMLVT